MRLWGQSGMHETHRAPWQVLDLLMPLTPFGFELGLRILYLFHKVRWWELPNIGTLLITLAFFCISLQWGLAGTVSLASDAEFIHRFERLKKRFGAYGMLCAFLFAAFVFARTIDVKHNSTELVDQAAGTFFVCGVLAFVVIVYEALFSAQSFSKAPRA